MRFRIQELCKSLIIVLLLLCAVFLALSIYVYSGAESPLLNRLTAALDGTSVQPPRQDQTPTLTDAAQPLRISVLGSTGRASFQGDFAALDGAFEALGGYLAGALDTAGAPAEIPLTDFREAVARSGVYFEYPCAVPLDVLAAWLDADTELTLTANTFLLTAENGQVQLFLSDGARCHRVSTELDEASFSAVLDDYPADGTFFALESPDFERLDPLTLIDPTRTAVAAGQSANPCTEAFLTATATTLGFNPYGEASYRDDAGSTIYTETDCSLRIDTDGTLLLRNQAAPSRFCANSAADGDRIEYARTLIEALTSGVAGDARLMLTGVTREEEQTIITFDYMLAGLPVRQADAAAVRAVFSGALLRELRLSLQTYTLSQTEQLGFLPAAQAAAVLPDGALLRLCYADGGDGTLRAGWLRGN